MNLRQNMVENISVVVTRNKTHHLVIFQEFASFKEENPASNFSYLNQVNKVQTLLLICVQ